MHVITCLFFLSLYFLKYIVIIEIFLQLCSSYYLLYIQCLLILVYRCTLHVSCLLCMKCLVCVLWFLNVIVGSLLIIVYSYASSGILYAECLFVHCVSYLLYILVLSCYLEPRDGKQSIYPSDRDKIDIHHIYPFHTSSTATNRICWGWLWYLKIKTHEITL